MTAVMESEKFAPFVRHDAYGPMARGDTLPMWEKLVLAVTAVTLAPLRFLVGVAILFIYYLICRCLTLFSSPYTEEDEGQEDYAHMAGWRRAFIVGSGRFFSRAILFVMGFYWIRTEHRGDQNEKMEDLDSSGDLGRAGVIVSNHVSYLDILYHMSASFPSFVAKRSVAKLILVGLISKCLGCVFVQRESKTSGSKGVSGVVMERIQAAHEYQHAPMMMLFPEGTTTNGGFILPFKTGAFLAKAPVRPVILKYPYQRYSPAWDSISGARHLFLLLCQFVNYMEVIRLPVYYPSDQEKEDPKLYADNVRKLMAIEGNLKLSDVGLPEKRLYQAALSGNNLSGVLHSKAD